MDVSPKSAIRLPCQFDVKKIKRLKDDPSLFGLVSSRAVLAGVEGC